MHGVPPRQRAKRLNDLRRRLPAPFIARLFASRKKVVPAPGSGVAPGAARGSMGPPRNPSHVQNAGDDAATMRELNVAARRVGQTPDALDPLLIGEAFAHGEQPSAISLHPSQTPPDAQQALASSAPKRCSLRAMGFRLSEHTGQLSLGDAIRRSNSSRRSSKNR